MTSSVPLQPFLPIPDFIMTLFLLPTRSEADATLAAPESSFGLVQLKRVSFWAARLACIGGRRRNCGYSNSVGEGLMQACSQRFEHAIVGGVAIRPIFLPLPLLCAGKPRAPLHTASMGMTHLRLLFLHLGLA